MSKAFDSIMRGLREALAFSRGDIGTAICHQPRGLFAQLTPEQQARALALDNDWSEAEREQPSPPKR